MDHHVLAIKHHIDERNKLTPAILPTHIGPTPGLMDIKDFISEKKYKQRMHRTYFNEKEERIADSSRTTPQDESLYDFPLGTWMIEDDKEHERWRPSPFGTRLFQLREIPFEHLEYTEDKVPKNIGGRKDDAMRYAQWMKEGQTPPPIKVFQDKAGYYEIFDGHRRAWACALANKPIRAWVNPLIEITKEDGKKELVGLTLELARKFNRAEKSMSQPRLGVMLKARKGDVRPGHKYISRKKTKEGWAYKYAEDVNNKKKEKWESMDHGDISMLHLQHGSYNVTAVYNAEGTKKLGYYPTYTPIIRMSGGKMIGTGRTEHLGEFKNRNEALAAVQRHKDKIEKKNIHKTPPASKETGDGVAVGDKVKVMALKTWGGREYNIKITRIVNKNTVEGIIQDGPLVGMTIKGKISKTIMVNPFAEGRPEVGAINSAMADIKTEVGLDTSLNLNIVMGMMNGDFPIHTAADYIVKVKHVFLEVKNYLDVGRIAPKSGKKLSLQIDDFRGSGDVAGQYNSEERAIHISPYHAGAIVHEIGHYLWDVATPQFRSKFKQWTFDSGLQKKILDAVYRPGIDLDARGRKAADKNYLENPANYWLSPTEIFARTVSAFLRMKAGRPDHTKVKVNVDKTRTDPFGWGFAEVDPSYDMFKDGKFEELFRSKFGKSLLKALIRLAMRLEKSK